RAPGAIGACATPSRVFKGTRMAGRMGHQRVTTLNLEVVQADPCATPSRVFKGTRMAGRMGHQRVTTLNLEVVQADPEREIVLIKGALPGPRGGVVLLRNAVKQPVREAG